MSIIIEMYCTYMISSQGQNWK